MRSIKSGTSMKSYNDYFREGMEHRSNELNIIGCYVTFVGSRQQDIRFIDWKDEKVKNILNGNFCFYLVP